MEECIAVLPATWRGQTQQTPSSLTLVSSTFTQGGWGGGVPFRSADPAHVNSVCLHTVLPRVSCGDSGIK